MAHRPLPSDARYAMLAAAARPGIAALTGSTGQVYSVAFSPDGKTLAAAAAMMHGAAVGCGHPPADREALRRLQSARRRRWRSARTARPWPAATGAWHGAAVGCGHPPADREVPSPASPARSTRWRSARTARPWPPADEATVRLWDVATRQQIGSPSPAAAARSTRWRSARTARPWPPAMTTARCGCGTWPPTSRSGSPSPRQRRGQVGGVQPGRQDPGHAADATMARCGCGTWPPASRSAAPSHGSAGAVYSVAFSPDGKTLATGSDDATRCGCGTWPPASRSAVPSPAPPARSTRWRSARTARPWPAAAGDGTVRLWDVATRKQIGSLSTGHTSAVFSVAFSPDGKTLASGSADGTVRLWDVATRQQDRSAPATSGAPSSPARRRSPRWRSARTARPWPPAAGRHGAAVGRGQPPADREPSPAPPARSSRWRSARTARPWPAGSDDGTVRLWDVATRQQIGTPSPAHTGTVRSVAFSPDGKTLATGRRRWHGAAVGRGHPPADRDPITAHTGAVYSVAFSPDGKTLASGGRRCTVRLWDVATHQQIGNPSPATPARSTRWRSARTARSWPAAVAAMTQSGCGIFPTWRDCAESVRIGRPIPHPR